MDSKRTDPLDDKMPSNKKQPQIPLPKSWDKYVKSGILHVFALAQYALIYSRSWAGRRLGKGAFTLRFRARRAENEDHENRWTSAPAQGDGSSMAPISSGKDKDRDYSVAKLIEDNTSMSLGASASRYAPSLPHCLHNFA